MMKWFLISFVLLFASPMTICQSFEFVVQEGFSSEVLDAKPLSNGDWIVIFKKYSALENPFRDTLSFAILDSQGIRKHEAILVPPFIDEESVFDWLHVRPNDHFIIAFRAGHCDVSSKPLHLRKFDSSGEEIWRNSKTSIGSADDILFSQEHSIMILSGAHVYSFSDTTGHLLWEAEFTTDLVHYGRFTSNDGDIIFFDFDKLHLASLHDVPESPGYIITQSISAPKDRHTILRYFQRQQDSVHYSYSEENSGIIRIDDNLQSALVLSVDDVPSDLIIDSTGIWLLNSFPTEYHSLRHYSLAGQLLNQYTSSYPALYSNHFQLKEGKVIFTGSYASGPGYSGPMSTPYSPRVQGWMQYTFPESMVAPLDSLNVSVSDVIRQSEVHIDSVYIPSQARYLYEVQGGDFLIEVTNHGTQMVEELAVNTSMQPYFNLFCGVHRPSKKLFYSDLNLQPSESVWLPFGDIYADLQEEYPVEFCFWTSAPDGTPDIAPEDDTFCHSLLVSNTEPSQTNFSVYPNPASHEISLQSDTPFNIASWQIYTLHGQRMLEGPVHSDIPFRVDVSALVGGFYIIQAGHRTARFLVIR